MWIYSPQIYCCLVTYKYPAIRIKNGCRNRKLIEDCGESNLTSCRLVLSTDVILSVPATGASAPSRIYLGAQHNTNLPSLIEHRLKDPSPTMAHSLGVGPVVLEFLAGRLRVKVLIEPCVSLYIFALQ